MERKGVFVTGTDTNVGKTWFGQQLIRQLVVQNINVVPRKPIESGWNHTDISQTDAWKLAQAAEKTQQLNDICPNRFSAPVSPVRAAQLENTTITTAQLKQQCLKKINPQQFLYIEGAGGFYSPLTCNGLNADLAKALNLPVILVAEDRLGCINQILLTLHAIEKSGLKTLAVVLNQMQIPDTTLMDNNIDLKNYINYPIIFIDYQKKTLTKKITSLANIIKQLSN